MKNTYWLGFPNILQSLDIQHLLTKLFLPALIVLHAG